MVDVIVIGLGVTGSAALHALARRGVRVLGLERHVPGHNRGSSHGRTRIIRLGYFEHPSYVPLLRHSYALWRALEREAGRTLLHVTGIVEIGPPEGVVVRGTLAAARLHALPHEVLTAQELMRRHPVFRLPPHFLAVQQPDGGFLEAEPSVRALVALAEAAGAQVRSGENVRAIELRGEGVRIVTDHGAVDAGTAIVAAGPWTKKLMPEVPAPLRATRQVMGWFAPSEPALFAPERFPVFLLESGHGVHYGVPTFGSAGLKVAKHHHRGESVDPDLFDRTVSADDEALIRCALADHLPGANGPLVDAATCLYTMMPDGDFLVDHLPSCPQVIVASPCSGHGFKFAPVIGEILADLATAGMTAHDIERFRFARGSEAGST